MEIRLRSTGEVMLEDQFRRYQKENGGPTWDRTTDEVLEALGADVVFEGAQATGGTVYQYSMRAGVEQVDGKWYSKYILGPVFVDGDTTAAQQEAAHKAQKDAEFAANARNQRDTLLTQTDWTQVADAPVDKAAWAAYRQALRDVPQQIGFPTTITWPVKP
jgi:Phage tail assembly chaperone protein